MVYKRFSVSLTVFILWLFIQKHALKVIFLAFVFTVHAFYYIYIILKIMNLKKGVGIDHCNKK